jgi:uncharacterized protein YndB with AHSA1/START domain
VPWIHAEPDADIEATTTVAAPPEEVFAFLADLGNHWIVADRFVEVVELHRREGGTGGDGGVVQVRGPLGLRRTATTRVVAAKAPRLLIGTAELGSGTRARVSWALAAHLGSTRVRLAATVERATPLDRAVLALGGRWWLQRRFAATVIGLAERFATGRAAPTGAPAASSG